MGNSTIDIFLKVVKITPHFASVDASSDFSSNARELNNNNTFTIFMSSYTYHKLRPRLIPEIYTPALTVVHL